MLLLNVTGIKVPETCHEKPLLLVGVLGRRFELTHNDSHAPAASGAGYD